MNARRLTLAIVVSLSSLLAGMALAVSPALACPNEASRQGPSLALPECRVYEQVTPVDKGDTIDLFQASSSLVSNQGEETYEVHPIGLERGYAAEDGEAFLLQADASLSANAPSGDAAYVFSRGEEGWHMGVVAAPLDGVQTEFARVFDPVDLSRVGFSDGLGSFANLYAGLDAAVQRVSLLGPVGGPYATLASLSGLPALEGEREVSLVGGSTDLSKVILEGLDHSLAPGAEGQDEGSTALYESAGGGECTLESSNCKLVNVDPEGKLMTCGAGLGQANAREDGAYSAVSSDGSKVFFTAPDPEDLAQSGGFGGGGPGCWSGPGATEANPPQVYVRIDGERTVQVSAPQAGVTVGTPENPLRPAIFAGASADGSKVFFITATELTKDDTGHAPELYEYETQTGKLTRVSRGEAGGGEGDVDFVAAVSKDGSAVYFTAWKALAPGAVALEEYPPGGEVDTTPVNLYRYDTLTGKTTYIAQVGKKDYPPRKGGVGDSWSDLYGVQSTYSEFPALGPESEWYTTGDGQYLVFGEQRPITGYDDVKAAGVRCVVPFDPGGDNVTSTGTEPGPRGDCYELYRYNANAAEDKEPSIVCVSCFGGAPIGDAWFDRTQPALPASLADRPISENGEDVFFDDVSALVPQAAPGKVHVYEWHAGTLSLISAPSDPSDAFFLGSSASGRDVFFATHAQLAPADTDESADIYDARVGGGFAGLTPSQCTGTGCQGVPGAPPIFSTPSSVTFEGVGNFAAPEAAVKPASKPRSRARKCRAGLVKKHGKCVKLKLKKKAKKSAKGRK
jgi:hypothetical protein